MSDFAADPENDSSAPQNTDEAKAKFKEALERKRSGQAAGQEHRDGDSKIHGTHGSASNKRTFRRKSGG